MGESTSTPLFILSAPRCYSSVACAMLGQHPGLYGLPETHLFDADTLDGWFGQSETSTHQMAHGLLRAVAEIVYGRQTEESVVRARGWLRRRMNDTSGLILEELSAAVAPRRFVEKSPSVVYRSESLERIRNYFPAARFLHLVRHPMEYGRSVFKYLSILSRPAYQPQERPDVAGPGWLHQLASFSIGGRRDDPSDPNAGVDAQFGWLVLNENITSFLSTVPQTHWRRMRGEDLLARPERELRGLLGWLELESGDRSIDEMMHPERSPYACFGPRGARLGNDILFLESPRLQIRDKAGPSLVGAVPWRTDGLGLTPEVLELAHAFGYR